MKKSIAKMTENFKQRYENDPKLQEFAASLRAKADKERKAKLDLQAKLEKTFREKFNVNLADLKVKKAEVNTKEKLSEQLKALDEFFGKFKERLTSKLNK